MIHRAGRYVPVEVKLTERPTLKDARHIRTFLDEHPRQARRGFVICRAPRPLALDERVVALPWFCL